MKKYPSLHMNTHYSLLESTIDIDSIISLAKKEGSDYLVITDHNNMYGVAEFISKCRKNGIRPVVGVDLDVSEYRLILIAKNYHGYQFLTSIVSKKAKGEEIKISDIDPSNIVIIDHPKYGSFVKTNQPLHILNYFAKGYEGSSLSIKFANMIGESEEKNILLSKVKGVDPIPSSPYTFIVDDGSIESEQSIEIIKQCSFEMPHDHSPLPTIDHGDKGSNEVLRDLIISLAPTILADVKDKSVYKARLNSEMKVISTQGFSDYFFILYDMVTWARSVGISIGPGRGSAAGSLISYILGITEIDPIKFDLLFERFLNPERISLPDIDIDIQDNRRSEVIRYLFDKYGEDKVALISTFQRIGAKMAIRDVGRAMSLPMRDVDTISKSIPPNSKLAEAYKSSAVFAALVEKNNENRLLFKQAQWLEGVPRQQGTHAAGLVISDRIIKDYAPTTLSSDGLNQVQFPMGYLEENGLLKIDLLGLRNLTILQSIKKLIKKTHGKKISLKELPLNDKETFKLLSSGDTNGIFQFESHGMKKTLRQVGVDSFDDIPAILSLFRPGPMEYIDAYAKRKNGEKFEKIHPDFDSIVKATYGIIIYQEQIMLIAQKFSGMRFGQADILRRAISKKKFSLIESQKEVFVKGAIKQGHNIDVAEKIYKQIEKFANYGFNKSHAVAYSMLSYRLAFMKSRFPFEFYTSLMASSTNSSDTLSKYIIEAKRKNIKIISPSINLSGKEIDIKDKSIVLPFGIIKGIGKVSIEQIISIRKEGVFPSFFEAVHQLAIGKVGESTMTLLIESGSMREFGNIETLLSSLPAALRFSALVGNGDISEYKHMVPKIIAQKVNVQLDMAREKKLFGFNLNAFASLEYETDTRITNIDVNEIKEVVFSINGKRESKDKNQNTYGRYNVSDSTATIDIFVFESDYKYTKLTKNGAIVSGKLKCRTHNGKRTYNLVGPWKVINE